MGTIYTSAVTALNRARIFSTLNPNVTGNTGLEANSHKLPTRDWMNYLNTVCPPRSLIGGEVPKDTIALEIVIIISKVLIKT